VRWDRVHLVRRPLIGLFYQPRMIDKYGSFGGIRSGKGNPKYSEKKLPQCHFLHHKSPMTDLRSNRGLRGGKPATNRLII
jgi:hypothetical protein